MEIIVLKQAQKELQNAPKKIREDIFALFEHLVTGQFLRLPISRPLPSIAKNLHELRLSGRAGEFRVFYMIKAKVAIYILLAGDKKSQKVDRRTIDLIHNRIRSLEL